MEQEQAAALRKPFPKEQIGKLPKAGMQLDYVGHAAVTDRLLSVDPNWTWEPVAFDSDGAPLIQHKGNDLTLWIRLTVCDVTRIGVGSVNPKVFDPVKQLVSDALRNAAMRFGVALDLWSKEELSPQDPPQQEGKAQSAAAAGTIDPFQPKFPMNQPQAKKALVAYLDETFVDQVISKQAAATVWGQAKTTSSATSIGVNEWAELTGLADAYLDSFFKDDPK